MVAQRPKVERVEGQPLLLALGEAALHVMWCTSVAGVSLPSCWHRSHSGEAVSLSRRNSNHLMVCISLL